MGFENDAARYFAEPSNYLRNNPYIDLRARLVRSLLPPIRGAAILDIGAGDGSISRAFLTEGTNRLTLLDASPAMLELALSRIPAAHRGRVDAIEANLTTFKPSRRYELVLCIGVLAHIADWRGALSTVASCVSPGGCCVIQLTDVGTLNGRLTHGTVVLRNLLRPRSVHETSRMTLEEVGVAAHAVGLEVTQVTRYTFVPGLRALRAALARRVVDVLSSGLWQSHGGEALAVLQRHAP
jgi:2-polyprenyl-3-methyl-5-hydroxy-6-metoxy-1,4-benzoquinol methylase